MPAFELADLGKTPGTRTYRSIYPVIENNQHPAHPQTDQCNRPNPENDEVLYQLSSSESRGHQEPTHIKSVTNALRDEFISYSATLRNHSREGPEASDFLKETETSGGEESDADSDYLEFQEGIARFKEDVRNFREIQKTQSAGEDDSEHESLDEPAHGPKADGLNAEHELEFSGRRGRGVARGPRKAAEPTGDLKLRLSRASEAFIAEDYDKARELVSEIVRINAETYEAWALLASIFKEIGDSDKALMALMYGAHLRPKDTTLWMNCARFALEETGKDREKYLSSASFCYAAVLRADPKNVEARLGKAAVCLEDGNLSIAISEYRTVLGRLPHDTGILRCLAEAYIDQDDVASAKALYKDSIAYYKSLPGIQDQSFGWSDVNIYIELYGYSGEYNEAINELRALARWLLGRESDCFWDMYQMDDREWDFDDQRRVECPQYINGQFPSASYGEGLPIELRVKLSLYRLHLDHQTEALHQLSLLESLVDEQLTLVLDYPHLFRQISDELYQAGLYQKALNYYQQLESMAKEPEALLYVQIGKCYLGEKLNKQAEECFQAAIQIDDKDIEARMQLAKLYEELNEQQQAFIFVNEVISLRRNHNTSSGSCDPGAEKPPSEKESLMPSKTPRAVYKPRRLADPTERQKEEQARAEHLQNQYSSLRTEHVKMRAGDSVAIDQWMEAAKNLIDDFRGFKPFYPWDKYVRFLGYTGDARLQAETALDSDLTAMVDRLSHNLEGSQLSDKNSPNGPAVDVPADYRGIPFATWLDIFLEYSLCLARRGFSLESYEICEAAKDAIVFYHSREDMFLIHICWCVCALLSNDEKTCVSTARFFMRDYQFTTDSYRLFSAVTRTCQSPISWYCSGPTQKFILRQIKAMDYALVDEFSRERYFTEKGSYSSRDKNGKLVINHDMDIALLMLYGHILYTGTSYIYALNYFFRAHALDPSNAVINLNIGLAYIHHSLKRQAGNRQHLILQGLSFLFDYYDSRKNSVHIEERQEAHFNIARVYNMLGLVHLAAPYYEQTLDEVVGAKEGAQIREDLAFDAAYSLRTIYSITGNQELANNITERWLVLS